MSYRITEACRHHVPICKDMRLFLSKKNWPPEATLTLTDDDKLNTEVYLPDYELQYDVENMIIKLVNKYTGRECSTAFLGTWHWLFQGLFEEWNGKRYIHSIRFFRDDDKYEIIEPVNKIWNFETNVALIGDLTADNIVSKTITVDNLIIKNQIPPEKRPPGWNPGDPITIDIIKQFPNDTAVTMEMLKTVINDYETKLTNLRNEILNPTVPNGIVYVDGRADIAGKQTITGIKEVSTPEI